MTRDEHEDAAQETANEARRRIRDQFQAEHPKYVPPPWADNGVWERFVSANYTLHGVVGFAERNISAHVPPDVAARIVEGWGFPFPTPSGVKK